MEISIQFEKNITESKRLGVELKSKSNRFTYHQLKVFEGYRWYFKNVGEFDQEIADYGVVWVAQTTDLSNIYVV